MLKLLQTKECEIAVFKEPLLSPISSCRPVVRSNAAFCYALHKSYWWGRTLFWTRGESSIVPSAAIYFVKLFISLEFQPFLRFRYCFQSAKFGFCLIWSDHDDGEMKNLLTVSLSADGKKDIRWNPHISSPFQKLHDKVVWIPGYYHHYNKLQSKLIIFTWSYVVDMIYSGGCMLSYPVRNW